MPKVAQTSSGGYREAKQRRKSNPKAILADNINQLTFTNSAMPRPDTIVHRLADDRCIRHESRTALAEAHEQRYWRLDMPSRRANLLASLIQD